MRKFLPRNKYSLSNNNQIFKLADMTILICKVGIKRRRTQALARLLLVSTLVLIADKSLNTKIKKSLNHPSDLEVIDDHSPMNVRCSFLQIVDSVGFHNVKWLIENNAKQKTYRAGLIEGGN